MKGPIIDRGDGTGWRTSQFGSWYDAYNAMEKRKLWEEEGDWSLQGLTLGTEAEYRAWRVKPKIWHVLEEEFISTKKNTFEWNNSVERIKQGG